LTFLNFSNVSKYNYCYSDHLFPDDAAEFPHHKEMYNYVKSYADKHSLFENIEFNTSVISVESLYRASAIEYFSKSNLFLRISRPRNHLSEY
jgi:cation diffusion facilitator CzcD-associated flavoprotein CzcO